MVQIKLVSGLKDKFTDNEKIVNKGEPVYLTKNGYDSMVVLSLEAYSKLIDGVESTLDEANYVASKDDRKYAHDEVFVNLRGQINS